MMWLPETVAALMLVTMGIIFVSGTVLISFAMNRGAPKCDSASHATEVSASVDIS